jgi:hypothetical protein
MIFLIGDTAACLVQQSVAGRDFAAGIAQLRSIIVDVASKPRSHSWPTAFGWHSALEFTKNRHR